MTRTQQPATVAQPPLGVNWTPIIQGLVSGVATSFGASVQFPTQQSVNTPSEVKAVPISVPSAVDQTTEIRINRLETQLSQLESKQLSMESQLTEINSAFTSQLAQTNSNLSEVKETMTVQYLNIMGALQALQTKTQGNGSNSNDTPPSNTSQNSPSKSLTSLPEIKSLRKVDTSKLNLRNKIVTADLEAIVDPNTGNQLIYMAAWYNGSIHKILDISQFEYSTTKMLESFWQDLIAQNKGRTCYFHNWGGYDSILSMASLFNLEGYAFEPMINNGEVMCLIINKR